jgi:diguanylate cyclase (GGDEF)-like protein
MSAFGVVAALAALSGAHALQNQVKVGAERGAIASARIVVTLVVSRNITRSDIASGSFPPDEQLDMDGDVKAMRKRGQLTELTVWSLTTGRPIYVESGRSLEQAVLSAGQLRQTRRGAFARSASDAGKPTMEVMLPYRPDDTGDYGAVVEIRLSADPIDEAVQVWTRISYGGAGAAALFAFVVVVLLRRRRQRQEYAIRHDALTGLGNRALLVEATSRALGPADQLRPVAMLLLDLDGFKEVNDTLGHDAGDELLVLVADRLRTIGADAETVVRLGGDEFVVLFSGLDGVDAAVATGAGIRALLSQPIVIAGLPVEIDASVGVAVGPEHGSDPSNLLKRAEAAMYEAKRSGTGVAVYDTSTDSRVGQHLSVLAELRHAITAGELRLYYQPKCHSDGRIDEVEALVRWQHPTRGLLPPGAFVPLAEQTSLIKPLTAWVLQEAARQCRRWCDQGRELTIAANVSVRNLLDDELVQTLVEATADAGIPVGGLQLEITETAVMTDPARVTATLAELFRLGVHLSIDDFGAGYTSLAHLSTLPVRALKIDRRFITDLLTNPFDETLVRNVVRLARDLGLVSIAEGVESAEVWQRLADLGCDEIQGYVLTRPLPPADFERWLDHWNPETGPMHLAHRHQPAGLG